MTKSSEKIRRLTTIGIFIAIIVVMTFVPYTGYIGLPGNIEITTLHIPVIICAIFLGWKAGAVVGGVWGITCIIKAFIEPSPAHIPFQNPMISLVPRIIVGIVVGLLFTALSKKLNKYLAASIAALVGTITNTITVISALLIFDSFQGIIETAKNILTTVISTIVAVNGIIEILAAMIIVPAIFVAVDKATSNTNK